MLARGTLPLYFNFEIGLHSKFRSPATTYAWTNATSTSCTATSSLLCLLFSINNTFLVSNVCSSSMMNAKVNNSERQQS